MTRLLRSELRKVTTTRLWWAMMLGAMAFAALGVVAQIAGNGVRDNPAPPLTTAVTQRAVFAAAFGGYIFAAVVGVILVTTEYRHFTSRPTFLLSPHRAQVVAAKIVVSAGVGLLYGVACLAVVSAIAIPWLSAKGITIAWSRDGLAATMLGAIGAVAIFAVAGVGVGVLVRNQVAAVISALAYLFIVEPLFAVIPGIKEAFRYLPGAAGDALAGANGRTQVTLLTSWQGGLLLLGWGLLFAAAGWLFTVRRDVP